MLVDVTVAVIGVLVVVVLVLGGEEEDTVIPYKSVHLVYLSSLILFIASKFDNLIP